jgi:putative DNA primase/helicase
LWLVGGGGNGKSVLLNVLTHLVGAENVSHAHIEQLGKNFVRAELEGKLLNISPEISANAKMADGYLKQIVSADKVQAERKFKPSFSFRPFVKLIAATNHLPRLTDSSEGFFRRAIILTFNRRFAQAEQDPLLEGRLLEELPGILVWAVEGLQELRERGAFAIPPSSAAALETYRTESDPEGMFIESCLARVQRGGMSPAKIYSEYLVWCKTFGFTTKTVIGFGKRLSDFGFDHRRSRGKKLWLVASKPGSGVEWNL